MAQISKLNRPTKERMALIRGQASSLLWEGKLETTVVRAKTLRSYVEKLITLAMDTYEDTVKVVKTDIDAKGVKTKREDDCLNISNIFQKFRTIILNSQIIK